MGGLGEVEATIKGVPKCVDTRFQELRDIAHQNLWVKRLTKASRVIGRLIVTRMKNEIL
jgi:hypothetical protein